MPGENIYDWSPTADLNGSIDSLIQWPEGQARRTVNNSARGMMAAIAKQRNLLNGSITTTGATNAQTFVSGVGYTGSVPVGLRVLLRMSAGNTGPMTLNMDSIGAYQVVDQSSNALGGGEILGDSLAEFIFTGSKWMLLNRTASVGPPIIRMPTGGSGILTYVNPTTLKFAPFNGNGITINGSIYQIPSAGIAGLSNTGVYRDGAPGQTLQPGAVYLVFVFSNNGVLTADYSINQHSTSTFLGNEGTEIKTGDQSRTLIGLVRMSLTGTFADQLDARLVRSWFNRKRVEGRSDYSSNISSTSYVEVGGNGAHFVAFAGECTSVSLSAVAGSVSGAPFHAFTTIALDGLVAPPSGSYTANLLTSNGEASNGAFSHSATLAEGWHYYNAMGKVSAGTMILQGSTYVTVG